MLNDYRNWRAGHPQTEVFFHFKIPEGVAVVSDLKQAIRNGFLVANPAGMVMLEELGWLDESPNMPTLLMVQGVIEHAYANDSTPGKE
jgi:hypothetical protein